MRQVVLLGNPDTKRTIYLEQGAKDAGVPIRFLHWKDYMEHGGSFPEETFLKIDPPLWNSCCLEELENLAGDYEKELENLAIAGEEQKIWFLNHPRTIKQLLEKRQCKEKLEHHGIPVTEALKEKINDKEQLLEAMEKNQMFQVFLKPVKGSGAAGVAAFRYQKNTGKMALYTCMTWERETGRLVNTKRLRQFTDRRQVFALLDKVLGWDCMVERWYAKADHQGYSYDLRVVVQKGETDFILARLSKGPITNLHLNNHPLPVADLSLPLPVLRKIEELCRKAAGCYQGLNSVGVDVLLEKNSLRPRVIEMNGQGDLIYQDIYDQNRIYRHQAEMMKEWLYGKDG